MVAQRAEVVQQRCPAHSPVIFTATAVDIFTQLVLHEVHHRAQVMNMLTRLGVGVGDIDSNLLMYQRREAK
jgi:uncharacterized damage-inducible protein DinB